MTDDDALIPADQVEQVPLPFRRTMPSYRREIEIKIRTYVSFSTWEDPEEYLEDDANAEYLIERAQDADWDYLSYDVDWPWRVNTEMQNEDGSWGPVDYDRIAEHNERENPRPPEEDG